MSRCFSAQANRLALTPAGRVYQGGLTQIFDALGPDDWPHWLEAAGVTRPGSSGPRFHGQALPAVANGLGVAMGIRPHIDDDIAAGRLIAPFTLSVSKGESWFLFSAFRAWIVTAARA